MRVTYLMIGPIIPREMIMKTAIQLFVLVGGLNLLLLLQLSAQEKPDVPDIALKRVGIPFSPTLPRSGDPVHYRIAGKRASQYTAEDWG